MKNNKYLKNFGFSNKSEFKKFLSSKDILVDTINWGLIEKQNKRLVEIFEKITEILIISDEDLDIENFVKDVFEKCKEYNHITKMNNRGRPYEEVFNSWLMGIIAERVFKKLIEKELNVILELNGDDDWTKANSFIQTANPDFINKNQKITVDVVCGKTDNPFDIKIHKLKAVKIYKDFNVYQFSVNIFQGIYSLTSLNSLDQNDFKPNNLFEGQLCYRIPDSKNKKFYK